MMKVLAEAKVVIILQYIGVSGQHIVHLKHISVTCQFYLSKTGENHGLRRLTHPHLVPDYLVCCLTRADNITSLSVIYFIYNMRIKFTFNFQGYSLIK